MSPLSSILSRGKDASDDVDAVPGSGQDFPATAPAVVVRVNLLPPEIAEAAAFKRGQVVRAGAVAAALVVAAGGVVMASNGVSSAEEQLTAEQNTAATLQSRVNALSIVPATQLRLDTARDQLRGAMGAEVNWATYLNSIGVETPVGISYSDIKISQTVDAPPADGTAPPTGGSTAPVSLLGTPGIATVTINGKARSHEHIAKFLEKLDNARIGNVDPYFTSAKVELDSTAQKDVVNFTAIVTVTESAKTNRFVKEGN